MVLQRRVFNSLPDVFKTDQNRRETYIADDVLFEPEQSSFLSGYIGDTSIITPGDLKRTPPILEKDAESQKYQLSIGAAYVDPTTLAYVSGSFYTDLLEELEANGALVDDPNRVFDAAFYAWTPPIDYDKHINFSRYVWTGVGTAAKQGEYITKEPAGSQTTLYRFNGTTFVKTPVTIVNSLPPSGTPGQVVEDASTPDRFLYEWSGTIWATILYTTEADIPRNISLFVPGQYIYVARTGPDWNRPIVWVYKTKSGRWISLPVVVNSQKPDIPRTGMVWEDSTVIPKRPFRIWDGSAWQLLTPLADSGPNGTPENDTYLYDIRPISNVDGWSANNWWRYYQDLSPADRSFVLASNSAIRPILEFWGNLESANTYGGRDSIPEFGIYSHDASGNPNPPDVDGIPQERDIDDLRSTSTIFQYQTGSVFDSILNFNVALTSNGDFLFELTLETDKVANSLGYRYFHDTRTNLLHSVWAKSDVPLSQAKDQNGLYEVPKNITSNPDHTILTNPSRSDFVSHMTSVIAAQTGFEGNALGLNNYRFTDKNPTVGATILDHEGSLLRALGLLQSRAIDLPDTIRQIAHEYNKVMGKFVNRMNALWVDGTISTVSNTLSVPARQAVDVVLTDIFVGRDQDFPFFTSDMGTYLKSLISFNVITVLDPTPRPILLPDSPARVGAAPIWLPGKFTDNDGITKIRCHDGTLLPSFGDERDLLILELENRIFETVPADRRAETSTFSARFSTANFHLDDFYGNFIPTTTHDPVDEIVPDYLNIVPVANVKVYSAAQQVFAVYDGTRWLTTNAIEDDVFINNADGKYYIFSGFYADEIPLYNKTVSFQYSDNEYRKIIRRDFERYVNSIGADFVTNTTFNLDDPFTWNYSSAGVEGNYKGIYRRVYGTFRPHSHPWEIAGYSSMPDWWLTQYVPTSYARDGTPRYANTHAMWMALKTGMVNPPLGIVRTDRGFTAPVPVDQNGELLDPIQSGMILESQLDLDRIDSDWVYGDGGPGEEKFYESRFYSFAVALAGYLMKPAQYVDRLWSDLYINVGLGETIPLWRAPHFVYLPTLTRPPIGEVETHLVDSSDIHLANQGLNAWISERVAINGGSPSNDFAKIITNTVPTLGWKTAGFINKNRTIIETLSGTEVPFEDVHVVLHQDPAFKEVFQSGLIVLREANGYRIFGYDTFNPFFRTELGAIPIAGGQIELREEFTATANQHDFVVTEFPLPQNSNDTAQFSVLVNGYKVKPQHYSVTGPDTFSFESIVQINRGDVITAIVITTQSNPSTQIKTFVIDGITFGYFAVGTGQFVDYAYGHFFPTASDVINFMVGHNRYLVSQGWQFSVSGTDQYDWLAGAKLFARWALDTAKAANRIGTSVAGETFLFSAMGDQAVLKLDFGFPLGVENVRNGAYGVVDRSGVPIPIDQTSVSRDEGTLTIKMKQTGRTQIYGVRVYLTSIQHVVFFSNTTKFNDLVYDPVIALAHKAFLVDTYRSNNWNGRLEAPGNIVFGDSLLPGFEKQTFDITRFYDRFNPVDDPVKRDQARNLYGYTPNKSYMLDIDAEDRTQFDFYLGFIHAKGTRRVFSAFTRGTRTGSDNVFITEDWLWRLADFGDLRIERVQFSVNKVDFKQQLQVVQFTDSTINPNEYILVPSFDRSSLPNPRWIIPPKASQFHTANFVFPTVNGLPDPAYIYTCKLYDLEKNAPVLTHHHWDPQLRIYEPLAYSEVDYRSAFDPARYNEGPSVSISGQEWEADHVGQFWWNTTRSLYYDYRRDIPNYVRVAHQWGKLLYFNGAITRTNQVVTVTTLDVNTNQPTAHHLVTGQLVSIVGANQTDYNQTDIAVTVIRSTQFTFTILTAPDTPATGDIQIIVGDIAVYEWVASPVPPSEWSKYIQTLTGPDAIRGEALNADTNPSFTQVSTQDQYGNIISVYYFWVRRNKLVNSKKTLSVFDVEGRLRDPVSYGIPLFTPINSDTMFIYTDGDQVQDGYAIDLSVDRREMESHDEWVFISEGDNFTDVPVPIDMKLKDSLSGIDQFGNPVPFVVLSDTEKYGSSVFPAQTVFQDRSLALEVYVTAVNAILKIKNFQSFDPLREALTLDTEYNATTNPTGYWMRTNYMSELVVSNPIFDTVPNLTERDRRARNGAYANGDVVHVLTAPEVDLWTRTATGVYYRYFNGSWTEEGIDNHTVAFNLNLTTDTILFRKFYDIINSNLTKAERNSLTFTMLYEMVRQNPICDWFIKTSYILLHTNSPLDQVSYVRPFEPNTIYNAVIDLKPFRTKIRDHIITWTLEEEMDVRIVDTAIPKITLVFDRLSCNLLDDHTWDSDPWDDWPWDFPIWEMQDLGRKYSVLSGSIQCDSTSTSFEVPLDQTPLLYAVGIVILYNGVQIDPFEFGLTITVSKTSTSVIVTLNQVLSPQYTIEVYLAQGFYESPPPTLGLRLEEDFPALKPAPSDYKHAAARLATTSLPCGLMLGCEGDSCGSELGGHPEERVPTDVIESMNITVTTSDTPAYAGWDTTPWDSAPWDMEPTDVGARSFFVLVGQEQQIEPGIEIYPTSQLVGMGTTPYVQADSQYYEIGQVKWDLGSGFQVKTEGVHWEFVSPFRHMIRILTPPPIVMTSTGAASYVLPIENGIDIIYVNDFPIGVSAYSVRGRTVTFFSPPPSGETLKFIPHAYIDPGDQIEFIFGSFDIGTHRGFIMISYPTLYRIQETRLVFDSLPSANLLMTINFTQPRVTSKPLSRLIRCRTTVDDMYVNHTVYDSPQGFATERALNFTVMDQSDNNLWTWDGAVWFNNGTLIDGRFLFVKQQQTIFQFSAGSFVKIWTVGETFSTPPLLDYRPFDEGVAWGTYALGQLPDAQGEWPNAYWIMNGARCGPTIITTPKTLTVAEGSIATLIPIFISGSWSPDANNFVPGNIQSTGVGGTQQ